MFSILPVNLAQAAVDMTKFGETINPIISHVVYPIIELLFGIAVLVFVYGVIQFIIHGNDEAAKEKGKLMITYGVIGLFIMVSAWGIIYVVSNTVTSVSKGEQIQGTQFK